MGLSITQGLLNAESGRVWVESGRGEYLVRVEKDDRITRYVIDAQSGQILKSEDAGALANLFSTVKPEAFANAETTCKARPRSRPIVQRFSRPRTTSPTPKSGRRLPDASGGTGRRSVR